MKKITILNLLISIVTLLLLFCWKSHTYCIDISSTVLTLIAICATLIVGMNIYDFFVFRDVHEKMKQFDEFEKRIKTLFTNCNTLFHHTWGLIYENESKREKENKNIDNYLIMALCEYWEAFSLCCKIDDIKRGVTCLKNAEMINELIIKNGSLNYCHNSDLIELLKKTDRRIINSNMFYAYKEKIESISKTLISIAQKL